VLAVLNNFEPSGSATAVFTCSGGYLNQEANGLCLGTLTQFRKGENLQVTCMTVLGWY
jgi:hypothetical protein